MKTRYFIYISFKGTSYHGWQIQPRSVTVQKTLDEALCTILGEDIATIGAGRTDAGVHARLFCAHFDSSIPDLPARKNLIYRLNRYLPKDISVKNIVEVADDTSARYSALSRTYKYFISRKKDPFSDDVSWYINGPIDIGIMNQAAAILPGYSDFTSFSKLHSDNKTNICKLYMAHWEETDDQLVFTIKADRFLRNMVRAIVGTLIDVGMGKMDIPGFEEIIIARDRCRAKMSAPAKGLFLYDIEYPAEIFILKNK